MSPADPLEVPTEEVKTVGLSPKVIAGAITTYVAGVVAAFVGNHTGLDYDPSVFAALVAPLALVAVQAAAAALAKPGAVVRKQAPAGPPNPRPR